LVVAAEQGTMGTVLEAVVVERVQQVCKPLDKLQ